MKSILENQHPSQFSFDSDPQNFRYCPKKSSNLSHGPIAPNRDVWDDPSGVLIPIATRYSQLYQVESSYTEQVIQSRVFLLFRVGYMEQNILSGLYRVEHFYYSEYVMGNRIFLLFRLSYTEQNISAIQFAVNHTNTSIFNIQFSKFCLHLLALFLIKDYVSY